MRESIVAEPPGLSSTLARDGEHGVAGRDPRVAQPTTAGPAVTTEWLSPATLAAVAPQWQALAARAIEPNVFYQPAFALAAAAAFAPDAGVIAVRSRSAPQRLLGLFPIRVERRRYGVAFPILTGWTHAYAPLGLPLVDRDAADLAIAAFFDHVSADDHLPNILLLPFVPHGPFATALDRVLARRGGRAAAFDLHQRALLAPGADRAGYLDHAVAARRRKELRRQRRRLEETGTVTFATATTVAAVGAALADFLALEARGWKGRRGTAAARHAQVRQFMESAITGLAADGMAQVHRLLVDDRPVAAAVTLKSANTAWFWKIAYDETVARASPGVQLTLDVTAALLADTTIERVDSCAAADHPMIDHLWRERLVLADRLIAIGPEAAGTFAIARRLEGLRRRAIALAKGVRDALRRS